MTRLVVRPTAADGSMVSAKSASDNFARRRRSARDGQVIRLPTGWEREKAARGADGRWFPWGFRFDPAFCKMKESRPGHPQPEPVGAFSFDESPYGVRDLAGGMRDWIADLAGEMSAETLLQNAEPAPDAARDHSALRESRGRCWFAMGSWCRAAARTRSFAFTRGSIHGMRVAKTLVRER